MTHSSMPGARFDGRVALVTGGARGQGASHVERLAREGAVVYAGDVLDEEGAGLVADLSGQGLAVHYRHLDVTDADDWAAVVADIRHSAERLDALVNNAGIIHVSPILEESRTDWDRILAVNVTGALLGIQAVVPLMSTTGGSIVNVASIFGVGGAIGYAGYTASKGALLALTKTAALELADLGIRVNAICPGGVSTPMNEHEKEGGVIPMTPLRRRAHVSEISGAVAFLAGDDASFVTGTELVVDGGYLAQ